MAWIDVSSSYQQALLNTLNVSHPQQKQKFNDKAKVKRSTRVRLPFIFTKQTLYELVRVLFKATKYKPDSLILDFSKLTKIEVGGVAVLSNLIQFYKLLGINSEFENLDKCKAKHYLDNIGFTHLYKNEGIAFVNHPEFSELILVPYDKSHSYINHKLIPWLANALKIDVRALSSVETVFGEIFNNIKDHSTVNIGCSCAHFDAQNKKIFICISDFGIGIPSRVKEKHADITDVEAIKLACENGFSTQTTPRNRGAGLHILINNIVTRNSGKVVIHSGLGVLTCLINSKNIEKIPESAPDECFYPGTMIYITIDTDKFIPSEFSEEEFSWD